MTRSTIFGAGMLYVGDQPICGVRDLRLDLDDEPLFDKVPLGPDSFSASVVLRPEAMRDFDALYEDLTRRAVAQARQVLEAEVRRMLGEWVSGLEPALLYDHRGVLVGLTIAGLLDGVVAPIVVPARQLVISQRACRVCGCMELSACMTETGPCYWAGDDICSGCV